jgi:hypothetical protein
MFTTYAPQYEIRHLLPWMCCASRTRPDQTYIRPSPPALDPEPFHIRLKNVVFIFLRPL